MCDSQPSRYLRTCKVRSVPGDGTKGVGVGEECEWLDRGVAQAG